MSRSTRCSSVSAGSSPECSPQVSPALSCLDAFLAPGQKTFSAVTPILSRAVEATARERIGVTALPPRIVEGWGCHVLLAGAATGIIFVATKVSLSRQYIFCHEKVFVATSINIYQKFCRDIIMLVTTIYFLSQEKFCRDKHTFVATNTCLSPENDTYGSSRQ